MLRMQLLEREESRAAAASTPEEREVTALFQELHGPLLRYFRSFGLLRPDAEDIVQEVFLALFRHLREGGSRQNLRGWVFRTGHNLSLKRRKRNGRAAELPEAKHQADPGLDPEQQTVRNATQSRLLAAVRALPEKDRCCLHLRAEGLRYREIARILDMSLGGVAISLSRSLARLARVEER